MAGMIEGSGPESGAARDAEVNGKPQRVAPLRVDELTPENRGVLDRIRASIGVSPDRPIPEYSLMMIKHPEIFRQQLEFGMVIFKGEIPARERELAVLRIAWLMGAPYEWGEHVDIGKRSGVTAEEIERATVGSTAPGWTAHEAAILRAVEEMLDRHVISDETWAVLSENWTDAQKIEFPMIVGTYVCTALHQNALRIRPEAANPGLTHR